MSALHPKPQTSSLIVQINTLPPTSLVLETQLRRTASGDSTKNDHARAEAMFLPPGLLQFIHCIALNVPSPSLPPSPPSSSAAINLSVRSYSPSPSSPSSSTKQNTWHACVHAATEGCPRVGTEGTISYSRISCNDTRALMQVACDTAVLGLESPAALVWSHQCQSINVMGPHATTTTTTATTTAESHWPRCTASITGQNLLSKQIIFSCA